MVHLKIAAYDRSLKEKGKRTLTIGVLHATGGNQTPVNTDKDMTVAFRTLAKTVKLHGLPLLVTEIPYDKKSLLQKLEDGSIDLLYVGDSLQTQTSTIAQMAIQTRTATYCGNITQARRGLAVAVDVSGDRPQITVNLKSAQRSGMDLNAQLLRMTTVIK